MTPEAFLEHVAWLGDKPSSVKEGGAAFGAGANIGPSGDDDAAEAEDDNDYIANVTATQGA